MFYGYLWNETLVEIQSYFIASVEMGGRKKQQRKQISGQKNSKKKRGAPPTRPGKYMGKMKDHLECLHQ